MSEAIRRRGRPKKVVEESPTAIPEEALAVEENSAQAKARQQKEVLDVRKSLEWDGNKYYYLKPFLSPNGTPDKKIILVRSKKNGSSYRTYVGRASKMGTLLEQIKGDGLLRE